MACLRACNRGCMCRGDACECTHAHAHAKEATVDVPVDLLTTTPVEYACVHGTDGRMDESVDMRACA